MDELDKKIAALGVLTQQTNRLVSKVNTVFALAGLLQESVNLNQQWSEVALEVVKALEHERKSKGTDGNGGEVPGAPRAAST